MLSALGLLWDCFGYVLLISWLKWNLRLGPADPLTPYPLTLIPVGFFHASTQSSTAKYPTLKPRMELGCLAHMAIWLSRS